MADRGVDVLLEAADLLPELAIEEFKVIYSEDIGFRDVADKINAFYSKS